MKKNYFYPYISIVATIVLSIFLCGCVKEVEQQQPQGELHEVVFHAGWAPETKTILQEDGSIWWSPGDEISLFAVEELNEGHFSILGAPSGWKLVATNDKASSETTFEGLIDNVNNVTYYAIYPYNSNNACGGKTIGITIPTIQTATPGTYDHSAFVSYAKTTGNNLYFNNLCGGIKFSVSQEGIKEVAFRYTSGDIASGNIIMDVQKDSPEFYSWRTKSDEVIVHAPNNSCFEVGKYYYAVMYPSKNEHPILVTYKKENTQASFLTKGNTVIRRSVFKRLYEKDKGLVFTPIRDGAIMTTTLPDGVDKTTITKVVFHPASSYATDINLGDTENPIYFELKGTIVNYYTPKEIFILKNITKSMFSGWSSLETVDFNGVNTSEATDFDYFFDGCQNLKKVDMSGFDTKNAINMYNMFANCISLETLDLSSFNTSRVTDMSQMFGRCYSLKELDISSFETKQCQDMSYMFNYCGSLLKLDMSIFDMSSVESVSGMCNHLAIHRKHCVIKASDETKRKMCESDTDISSVAKQNFIRWITPSEEFPDIVDPFGDLYKSLDYSKDKTYSILQKSTKGKGINIVIMGDAYSDRLINDGTYNNDLSGVIDNIFKEEPLRSLKEYFNVYICFAVSENESPQAVTALDLIFEGGSRISGGDGICDDYMRAIFPDYGWEWTTGKTKPYIIIVSNTRMHAGTTYFFGSGSSLILMALGEDETDLHYVSCHEFGHAIGKLADEYDQEGLTFSDIDRFQADSQKGFCPNLDITADPKSVKWHRFLEDSRYANEGLGVFEGGYSKYAYGIWRPTENSIMGSATTGFNAPSREAIYRNVNMLTDDSFVYDYETFVAFDQKSMSNANVTSSNLCHKNKSYMQRLPSPVFIDNGSATRSASTTISK